MPISNEWVDPEVAVDENVKGVPVYHLYKDNYIERGRLAYHFTLNELCDSDGNCSCLENEDVDDDLLTILQREMGDHNGCVAKFDIRELPTFDQRTEEEISRNYLDSSGAIVKALLEAIDAGILKKGYVDYCKLNELKRAAKGDANASGPLQPV